MSSELSGSINEASNLENSKNVMNIVNTSKQCLKVIHIIDTGLIIRRKVSLKPDIIQITSSNAINEIKSKNAMAYLDNIRQWLSIRSPTKKAMKIVGDIASLTNDSLKLSRIDMEIIALAVDQLILNKVPFNSVAECDKIIQSNGVNKPVEHSLSVKVCVLSGDYSIHNICNILGIRSIGINNTNVIIRKPIVWKVVCE